MRIGAFSSSTVAKLTKGENVSTVVVVKICEAIDCNADGIMDIVPKTE